MAEANKIVPGIIIGLVVAFGGQYIKSYMERPPALGAEVLSIPYAPPASQGPTNASCLISVKVENNTPRPAREIRVTADYVLAYSLQTQRKSLTTGSIAKDPTPYIIESLDPGTSQRMFIFTSWNCDIEGLHPGVRVFNDEGSAVIRNIVPPSGYLTVINEYYFAFYPLIAMGALVVLLIVVGGVIDLTKAASKIGKSEDPPSPTPPPTPGA
jgi:hypothetical protein